MIRLASPRMVNKLPAFGSFDFMQAGVGFILTPDTDGQAIYV
jgi:hypothetical protein